MRHLLALGKMTDPKELCGVHVSTVSLTSLKWIRVDYRTHKRKEAGGLFTSVSYSVLEQLVSLNGKDEIVVCTSVVLHNYSEIQSLITNGFYVIHLFCFRSLK